MELLQSVIHETFFDLEQGNIVVVRTPRKKEPDEQLFVTYGPIVYFQCPSKCRKIKPRPFTINWTLLALCITSFYILLSLEHAVLYWKLFEARRTTECFMQTKALNFVFSFHMACLVCVPWRVELLFTVHRIIHDIVRGVGEVILYSYLIFVLCFKCSAMMKLAVRILVQSNHVHYCDQYANERDKVVLEQKPELLIAGTPNALSASHKYSSNIVYGHTGVVYSRPPNYRIAVSKENFWFLINIWCNLKFTRQFAVQWVKR